MTGPSEHSTRDWDFGGIFRIHADQDYPLLQADWQSWKKETSKYELRISNGETSEDCVPVDSDKAVRDGSYQIRFRNAIYEVGANQIICQGSINESYLEHEVVIPTINRMVAKKGHYLAYASAVSHNGKVLIFLGVSGSGKTSAILEFLSRGASFMGDNNIFIDDKGTCTLYSPMIGFPERNAKVFPELVAQLFTDGKERRRQEKRLSFYNLGTSIKPSNFITRYAHDQFVSRFYFSHDAKFNRLFPQSSALVSGSVAEAFFLEPGTGGTRITEAKSEDLAKLATTLEWVYPNTGGSSHNTLAEAAGLEFCMKDDYRRVFEGFFSHARCHRVHMPLQANREVMRKTVDAIEKTIS
jgi:hypothetical protein